MTRLATYLVSHSLLRRTRPEAESCETPAPTPCEVLLQTQILRAMLLFVLMTTALSASVPSILPLANVMWWYLVILEDIVYVRGHGAHSVHHK